MCSAAQFLVGQQRCWALPLDGRLYGLVDDVAQCLGELSSPSPSPAANDVLVGQTVATIEAMKMEAAITAPKAATVQRIAVSATAQVEGGDLLVVLR